MHAKFRLNGTAPVYAAAWLIMLGVITLVGHAELSRSDADINIVAGQKIGGVQTFQAQRGFIQYQVRTPGDSLSRRAVGVLAARFRVNVNAILNANDALGSQDIKLGPEKQIRIPL